MKINKNKRNFLTVWRPWYILDECPFWYIKIINYRSTVVCFYFLERKTTLANNYSSSIIINTTMITQFSYTYNNIEKCEINMINTKIREQQGTPIPTFNPTILPNMYGKNSFKILPSTATPPTIGKLYKTFSNRFYTKSFI